MLGLFAGKTTALKEIRTTRMSQNNHWQCVQALNFIRTINDEWGFDIKKTHGPAGQPKDLHSGCLRDMLFGQALNQHLVCPEANMQWFELTSQ